MTHNSSCEHSRNKKRCKCSCKGSMHGIKTYTVNLDRWFKNIEDNGQTLRIHEGYGGEINTTI